MDIGLTILSFYTRIIKIYYENPFVKIPTDYVVGTYNKIYDFTVGFVLTYDVLKEPLHNTDLRICETKTNKSVNWVSVSRILTVNCETSFPRGIIYFFSNFAVKNRNQNKNIRFLEEEYRFLGDISAETAYKTVDDEITKIKHAYGKKPGSPFCEVEYLVLLHLCTFKPSASSAVLNDNDDQLYTFEMGKGVNHDGKYISKFVSSFSLNEFSETAVHPSHCPNGVDEAETDDRKIRFLTAQYFHPSMKNPIDLTPSVNHYTVGNELFSPSFILRSLHYQKEPFFFDYDYTMEIIDNKLNTVELKCNEYIYIKNKDTYTVKTI